MNTVTNTAICNLKYNKMRSILISIAISLTTCLLIAVGFCGVGLLRYNVANVSKLRGDYQGVFVRLSEETLEQAKLRAEIIKYSEAGSVGTVESDQFDGGLIYADDTIIQIGNLQFIEGGMPKKYNEIAAQKEFFEKLGADASVGETVSLSCRLNGGVIEEKEFVVSGILSSNQLNDLQNIYSAYVSKEFFEKHIPIEDRVYSLYFKVSGEETLSYSEMKERINAVGGELGLDERNIVINDEYLSFTTMPATETVVVCVVVALIVVIFSALVIYNIYYVGIITKIQEFGKLRAIGSTKKQLRGIILIEGLILSGISIPIGLILGAVIAKAGFYILVQNVLSTVQGELKNVPLFSFPILIIVVLTVLFTVYISLKKPMRIASNVSPVEAIRYQENTGGKKVRKGYDSIDLMKLISANMVRNKKRTFTTIFTMGLSCIMFVIVANVVGNMDPKYAARTEFEKGDFILKLDYSYNDKVYPENNLNNIQSTVQLGEDFINQLAGIDGVTEVSTRKIILGENQKEFYPFEDRTTTIAVLSKEDFENRAERLELGELNYDTAFSESGIVCNWVYSFGDSGMSIGEKIPFRLYDGHRSIEFEGKLMAVLSNDSTDFTMTEDTFNKLGFEGDLTTVVYISCEKEKRAQVQNEIESLIAGNEKVDLSTYENAFEVSKLSIRLLLIPSYMLFAIIGVIGFMNMANTLIISIVTRKREFGVLQAIGLTRKQLSLMLQMEGLIFTFGTLIISFTLGNAAGYALFQYCKDQGFIGLYTYHLPLQELLVMSVLLLVMQFVLSVCMSIKIQKEEIIDRIRYE